MDQLYRLRYDRRRIVDEEEKKPLGGVQNPISPQAPCGVVDGGKKTLDYLDYYGVMNRGALAAGGSFKPFKRPIDVAPPPSEEIEPYEDEWSNIFCARQTE